MNEKNKIIYSDHEKTIFSIVSPRRGYFEIIIDTEDIGKINKYKWHVSFEDSRLQSISASQGFKKKEVRLSKLITGYKIIDHINGDVRDNRKRNLRECSVKNNNRNVKTHKDNRTGYKGVTFYKNRYIARITVNYKPINLGSYKTKEEAAIAYNKAAAEHFGEFARLNNMK